MLYPSTPCLSVPWATSLLAGLTPSIYAEEEITCWRGSQPGEACGRRSHRGSSCRSRYCPAPEMFVRHSDPTVRTACKQWPWVDHVFFLCKFVLSDSHMFLERFRISLRTLFSTLLEKSLAGNMRSLLTLRWNHSKALFVVVVMGHVQELEVRCRYSVLVYNKVVCEHHFTSYISEIEYNLCLLLWI